MEGVVKAFSRNRGFGFISVEGGEDIFVHHSELVDPDREYLVEGQRVTFDVAQGDRGPRAVKVHVTGEVTMKKERQLDWRGRRHGHPRAGDVPQAALRARHMAHDEEPEEEEE